ncbi:MAG: 1-acyl-sn-glycerol-3-phosphate acyltransferase [Acidobacteriota bacterium]
MAPLRVLLRVPLIALVTILASSAILLSALVKSIFSAQQLRWRNAAFRWWGRSLCRVLGMRIEVIGKPPTGKFFLVANHVSYVDIILLASQVSCSFIGKADLRGWPLLGWAFRNADTIFIDRGRKRDLLRVLQQVRTSLNRGLGVLAFPEGTSSRGESILPLKPSLLEFAIEAEQPVHFVTLGYRTTPGLTGPPADEAVCWWDDTHFLVHFLRLLRLPSFEATLNFGSEPVAAEDRKRLAEELRTAMLATFTPIALPLEKEQGP